jgi:hypothetical protein
METEGEREGRVRQYPRLRRALAPAWSLLWPTKKRSRVSPWRSRERIWHGRVRVWERVECRVSRDGARESLEKDGEGDRRVGTAKHAHYPQRVAHETEETRQNKNTGLLVEV